MIIEFQDTKDNFDHNKFQAWRTQYTEGIFINVKSSNNIMIHRVTCSHFGDSEWQRETGWGSLTNYRKICSENVSELQKTAAKNFPGAKLRICSDCKPL